MSDTFEPITRPSCPQMDAILGDPRNVLDHGFVRLIDYMGDEAAIVQAARVSYGRGTKTPSDDRGLIRYLMRRYHTTPFEMCEIKVHMKLPIFVARQWIRHRTANVNEYSARYSILANEFFIPTPGEIAPQSQSNNQGREGGFSEEMATAMSRTIQQHSEGAYQIYDELRTGWPWVDPTGTPWLDYSDEAERQHAMSITNPEHYETERGMARELARMVLPVNAYTEWYWKVDLHNLLHLLRLRVDPHAQAEIRAYANELAYLVGLWLPTVWEAFEDYQLHACTFSRIEMDVLRDLLEEHGAIDLGIPIAQGMSVREHAEFEAKLGVDQRENEE